MKSELRHFEKFRSKCGKKATNPKSCRKADSIALFTESFLTAVWCHGAERGGGMKKYHCCFSIPSTRHFPTSAGVELCAGTYPALTSLG